MTPAQRVLLIGDPGIVHVGAHFSRAAASLGYQVHFVDVQKAYEGSLWRRRADWWLRDRRPSRLREFSGEVVRLCRELRPRWLLSTGLAPIEASALGAIEELGVQRVNFLTDDPWNPSHRAQWFMRALPRYDNVFSPRRANLADLRGLGCYGVRYLPFGYAPEIHYPDPPATAEEVGAFESDVVFAGGADRDRVPYMRTLLDAGFKVALYGGYWERFPATRRHSRGHADPAVLRKAIGGAKVALCLVRRANRDGHAMRSFEVPAIGACMLMEDTQEHREIFGDHGRAVVYFHTMEEMARQLRRLVHEPEERHRLASEAHRLVAGGGHTYRDRLLAMLEPAAIGASVAAGLS